LVHEYDKFGYKGQDNNWTIYRLDYGWTAGFGAEFKKFTFGLSYSRGIRDIDALPDYVLKKKVYSINATYELFD
jgi:hypothetical protein